MNKLPQQYHTIIEEALLCYESDKEMKISQVQALEFAKYMLTQMRDYIE